MHAEDINVQSRYGSGVRVMRLAEGDRVAVLARTDHDDEAEIVKPEAEGEPEQLTEAELAEIAAAEKAEETAEDEAAENETEGDEE